MMETNKERLTPELNDLVHYAASVQDRFDRFDPRTDEDQKELQRICNEWTHANRELVKFILTHGQNLLEELTYDGERTDGPIKFG